MNMMIRPILPYYSSMTQADGLTVVSMLLLLIGAVFAAFCIAMYAANGQQGEKRKTVLLFREYIKQRLGLSNSTKNYCGRTMK